MPVSDPPVQKGVLLKVGFGNFSYTGYVPESVQVKNEVGSEEIILDENGNSLTKILMDPRTTVSMTLVILDATGSITPPRKGTEISITVPDGGVATTHMTEDATADHAHGATKLNLSLINEDSIDYVVAP